MSSMIRTLKNKLHLSSDIIEENNYINELSFDRNYVIDTNNVYNSIDNLINIYNNSYKKTNIDLFKVYSLYNNIYRKYYLISLWIFILSSISTFIEAIRLIINDYINKQKISIEEDTVSMSINVICLILGTIITILSSIVRFRNYREILEQLKEIQNKLIEYKIKYKKIYIKLLLLRSKSDINNEDIIECSNELQQYENEIKTLNIIQYISDKDYLDITNNKAKLENRLIKGKLLKKKKEYELNSKLQIRNDNATQTIENDIIKNYNVYEC